MENLACYDDWDNSDLEDRDIIEKEAMHDAEYNSQTCESFSFGKEHFASIETSGAKQKLDSEMNENVDNLPTKPIYNVFDSLTIELLSNKTQYKKYILSKENPEKYDEYIQFLRSCKKHQNSILNLVGDLLIQPEHEIYDKEIKYAFEVFAKTCIKQLDKKVDQQKYSFYGKEEDTLFADMDNNNPIISSAPLSSKSMWGKSIRKISP